jgi:hypothetical protein
MRSNYKIYSRLDKIYVTFENLSNKIDSQNRFVDSVVWSQLHRLINMPTVSIEQGTWLHIKSK